MSPRLKLVSQAGRQVPALLIPRPEDPDNPEHVELGPGDVVNDPSLVLRRLEEWFFAWSGVSAIDQAGTVDDVICDNCGVNSRQEAGRDWEFGNVVLCGSCKISPVSLEGEQELTSASVSCVCCSESFFRSDGFTYSNGRFFCRLCNDDFVGQLCEIVTSRKTCDESLAKEIL